MSKGFAKDNLKYQRLEKEFKEKKDWIDGVPKLKTLDQLFNERGGYSIEKILKGSEMVGWEYEGPFDELNAAKIYGGYPFTDNNLKSKNINAINCHKIIDGGKNMILDSLDEENLFIF